MTSARMRKKNWLSMSIGITLLAQASAGLPVHATTSKNNRTSPAGTLLLPMTPRIDESVLSGAPMPTQSVVTSAPKVKTSPSSSAPAPRKVSNNQSAPRAAKQSAPPSARNAASAAAAVAPPAAAAPAAPPAVAASSPDASLHQDIPVEVGNDDATLVDENSLLRGTVQIVADDTEYDQEKNTFLGTGNAVAIIAGQDSKLEADTILYDQNSQTIDARGSVKILRNGQLTTGSSFKFKVNSDEYLITDPDTELQGTNVIARSARGTRDGLAFKNATFTLPKPFMMMNNAGYGPTSEGERFMEQQAHPDASQIEHPSFTFTARKMVFERYKESGQLTVFGGKMKFNHFTVPMPKFTANVGAENTRVVFPVTPVVGNNMMVGGMNIGPSFNYVVGKTGAFSVAPLLQFGGRNLTRGGVAVNNSGKVGAGFKLGYSSDRLSSHMAYGSNSDILVADFKYRISDKTMYQAGINRFLNDGFMGNRRARLISEVYDNRTLANVPYLSSVNFRTSFGWAQDNPGLVNLSGSQYGQLFSGTHKSKVSAYKLQEQITANSHPLFAVGDDKYGVNMTIFGAAALRAYSTGDRSTIGQFGPNINAKLGRFRLQGGYAQSKVAGTSPFVYDEFIQGTRSTFFNGDVKLSKWLTVGTSLGYNLDAKMMYTRAITAAVGPDDFKLVGRYDQISGQNRVGFDLFYGQPVKTGSLVMKGRPDAGQLGRNY